MRRIHQNDTENIALFLVIGFLFIACQPAVWVAQVLLYGYVVTRILHFVAYLTAQLHDVRALTFTPGALALMGMAVYVLLSAVT